MFDFILTVFCGRVSSHQSTENQPSGDLRSEATDTQTFDLTIIGNTNYLSVVRSQIEGANALCFTTKNRQDEIKHLKDTLKLNSYPNKALIKKPSNRTKQQFKGFAIIPYYSGLTEKIRRFCPTTMLKPYQNHAQGCRSLLSVGGDNLQSYLNFVLFSTLGGMNLDHDFFSGEQIK